MATDGQIIAHLLSVFYDIIFFEVLDE